MKRRVYAVIGWIATHLGLKYLKDKLRGNRRKR